MIIDKMKVTTVVNRATRFTREICSGVLSDIGANVKAPRNGIRISAVSIIK
jgi:ribosomal protein L20A (L18A)